MILFTKNMNYLLICNYCWYYFYVESSKDIHDTIMDDNDNQIDDLVKINDLETECILQKKSFMNLELMNLVMMNMDDKIMCNI